MATTRAIRSITKSRPVLEGAGVHLHRAIGNGQPGSHDPFLLLDDFRSDTPADYSAGFPWHPHRGMETVTYVLRGEVDHGDSLGNRGVIGPGDVQWMSAGSGIIHQEMPRGDPDGAMYGFQLWANLPAAKKMSDPRYQEIKASQIPEVKDPGGATIRVVAGTVDGVTGPVQDVAIRPLYIDVTVPPNSTFTYPAPASHTVFAYVFEGQGLFGEPEEPGRERFIGNRHLVSFGEGELIKVATKAESVRFLLVSGQPIHEPIAWGGPIVMNTQEELQNAFRELDTGSFIKHGKTKV